MNQSVPTAPAASLGLSLFAKAVVAMTFLLIFIGGHTTTSGAGMAFPDWPLSAHSLFPSGWWDNALQRLEHGHRMIAESVAFLVGILCAWVWGSKWSIPAAAGISAAAAFAMHASGAPREMVAHTGLWSAAGVFTLLILLELRRPVHVRSGAVRWLALAAFGLVLAQAVLGGLRVTVETGGDPRAATALRIVHGCVAQIELCLLVSIAAMLGSAWSRLRLNPQLRSVAFLAWFTTAGIFLQLVVGATMRHLGAGLAISTWPLTPEGGWMPKVHNTFLDLNFTHTRAGAALVALLAVVLALRTVGFAGRDIRLIRPAALLIALLAGQIALGALVIWKGRPPLLATAHVVNGAAILSTAVLLALRASHASRRTEEAARESEAAPATLSEATA